LAFSPVANTSTSNMRLRCLLRAYQVGPQPEHFLDRFHALKKTATSPSSHLAIQRRWRNGQRATADNFDPDDHRLLEASGGIIRSESQ